VDQRTDLYAFGLILYEMVTGEVPFTGDSTLKVMYQRIQEKPKNPKLVNPELPNWVARIIMRCLEKDPEMRYQSAYEILADLQGSKSSSTARTVQIQVPEFAQARWIWVAAAAVAVLLVAFAIPSVRHWILPGRKAGSSVSGIPPLSEGKFVAVLPFRILGDEQSLGYVAEGLNESLSAKLFQLRDLRMASETAASKAKPNDPLEKTGRTLGVNLIVQGIIQGTGDKMSIIVNLEDVADAKKLWSKEFSGNAKDLLTIEDQISAQLVSALSLKPTNEEMARSAERPTENVEAYDLYLRGRQALRGATKPEQIQSSVDYFEGGIKKDSSFALAYTGLADASLAMYNAKKDSLWAEKALGAALRAEQLKDNVPEVHFSLGSVYSRTGKTAQAIAELKRGLQLAPNSDEGYRRLGSTYLNNGQKEEAIAAYKKAVEVNPYYWMNVMQLGNAYLSIGENEKAREEYQRVTELEPDNVQGWDNLGDSYARMGKFQECISAFKKSIEIAPTWSAYSNLGSIYFLLKRYGDAVQMFEKAVALGPNEEMAVGNLADAYRWSGQKDKALATYDKAISLAFAELQVNPQNTTAMGSLALYFAKKGDPNRGMEFIKRARAIDKNDVALTYILAVVQNLANRPDDALQTLRLALSKGYPAEEAQADPELDNLKNRPEFVRMVKKFSQKSR
jgi:tetratricopeptide (TPR) repeat protein/TolB-like protein